MPRTATARRAPRCTKGFPCGGSCQAQGRRCNRPLPGQFSSHADWIAAGNAVHGGGGGAVTASGGSGGSTTTTRAPADYNPYNHRWSDAEQQTHDAISPHASAAHTDLAAVNSRFRDIDAQKTRLEQEQSNLNSRRDERDRFNADVAIKTEALKREIFPDGMDIATVSSAKLEEFSRRNSEISGGRNTRLEAEIDWRKQNELDAKKRDLADEERWARRDEKAAEANVERLNSEMREMMWRSREENVALEPQSPPPTRIVNDKELHQLRDYEETIRSLQQAADTPNPVVFTEAIATIEQRRQARERELGIAQETVTPAPAPVPAAATADAPAPNPPRRRGRPPATEQIETPAPVTETATPARRRGRPPALTEAERQKKEILAKAARVNWSEEDIRKVQGVRKQIPHREIDTGNRLLGKTTAAELISIGVTPPRDGDSVELTATQRERLTLMRRGRGNLGEREFLSRSPESESQDNVGHNIYSGERMKMYVSHTGTVTFTVDGAYHATGRDVGENMPLNEMKMMKKAWEHYLSQPRSRRSLDCVPATGDGRDREKWYQRFGFKAMGFEMQLHNQFDLPD